MATHNFIHPAGAGQGRPHVTLCSSPSRRRDSGPDALIARHLEGDPRAFTALVQRFELRLLNFVHRMIGDRERAEDLVQEAFVRVHRHLHEYDPSRRFSTWLYTIAKNLARNELRNRARKPLWFPESSGPPETAAVAFNVPDGRMAPDRLFEQRELRSLVDRSVASLAPHHREVFVLREVEGLSYEAIASIVGANLGTVKSRLNRARAAFAGNIAPHLN